MPGVKFTSPIFETMSAFTKVCSGGLEVMFSRSYFDPHRIYFLKNERGCRDFIEPH